MNQKGQLSFETILLVPIFLIVLYIAFLIMSTINSATLFPLLDNMSDYHGATMKLLIQLIPLILVLLVVVWVIRPKPPNYMAEQQGF